MLEKQHPEIEERENRERVGTNRKPEMLRVAVTQTAGVPKNQGGMGTQVLG